MYVLVLYILVCTVQYAVDILSFDTQIQFQIHINIQKREGDGGWRGSGKDQEEAKARY